jgi:hypothetical protein
MRLMSHQALAAASLRWQCTKTIGRCRDRKASRRLRGGDGDGQRLNEGIWRWRIGIGIHLLYDTILVVALVCIDDEWCVELRLGWSRRGERA